MEGESEDLSLERAMRIRPHLRGQAGHRMELDFIYSALGVP